MKTVRKFLFETDFDDADSAAPQALARKAKAETAAVVEAPPPPPPPPEPTFSEAELEAARSAAHAKGLKEGIARGRSEAQAQIESQIVATLTTLINQVAVLKAELTMDRAAILGEAASLALAMTRKMLPEFTRRGALTEVQAVIERCLVDLRREPRLSARVPLALLPELDAKIASLAAGKGFEGRLALVGDESLTGASCRIEWSDGGLERQGDAIWHQISAALDRCLTLQGITQAPDPSPAPAPSPEMVADATTADLAMQQNEPAAQTGDHNVGSEQATDGPRS